MEDNIILLLYFNQTNFYVKFKYFDIYSSNIYAIYILFLLLDIHEIFEIGEKNKG